MCRAHSVNVQNLIILSVKILFKNLSTDFFFLSLLIMLELWFFFSIPFLLSVIFLTLHDCCFVSWVSSNKHCKDEASSPTLVKCTKYCSLQNGHQRAPQGLLSASLCPLDSNPHVLTEWQLFCLLLSLQHLTCYKSYILPSVHSQSVSPTLLLSRCQHSASMSMESCEYFYNGASNALSIYF